jgi:hypothetical protein
MADEWAAEQDRWFQDPISNDKYRFDIVPIHLIDPSALNPRLPKQAHVDALVASMERHGQLVPGCAVEQGDRFELLGGHHRKLAMEIVARTRDITNPTFQLKILHAETTTARRLQIGSELNASVKPLNFGEKCRHMMRVREATLRIMTTRTGSSPTEQQLAEELGTTQGEDKLVFLLAPVMAEIWARGKINAWIDDHQHPVAAVRQRHDKQIMTVKNLAYFLWPFLRQTLETADSLPLAARKREADNAVRLTDLVVENVLQPLWDAKASKLHQHAVDFVRHHPFRALASCLAKSPKLFGGRTWPLWQPITVPEWKAIATELSKARTIQWGTEKIRNERSLANLGTIIAGMLYTARVEDEDAG